AVRSHLHRLSDARASPEGQLLLVPRLDREPPNGAAPVTHSDGLTVRAAAAALIVVALAAGASASSAGTKPFVQRDLVSDRNDPQLVNAWGLAAGPTGPWWVANEARSSSTLYAADCHTDRVLVYGSRWRRVVTGGGFVDRSIPDWYAPHGIQAVGRRIFVSYGYRAPVNGNDAPTGGYVDEFDLDGRLIARIG